mmetsp:Transcript_51627/g.154270  ORF Transcript_51627/g.154270 Transcript_51627/m.154270 type:complete len:398 (-) Transcript_51627:480-1673(-)
MNRVRVAHDLLHEFAAADRRVGGAQNVAADVPASCDGVHASTVDPAHGILHVALEHAMELPSLAGRDLEGSVCVALRDVVHGKPLLSRAVAARQAHTDHEAEGVLDAEFLALLAEVAVVLLVAAVELDELGVLEGHLASANVVESLLQGPSQLPSFVLDDLVRLHGAVVVASGCIRLVDTQPREELALPLAKACVVLVDVLVISEANRHEALRAQALHELVELPRRLGKVDLRLLRALAPVVRVPQAEDGVLQAAQGTPQVLGPIGELAPEVPAVAWELSLAGRGNAEHHEGLAGEGVDVKRVHRPAPHRAGGVAAVPALPRDRLGALLRVARVGGVEDGDGLGRVREALAQLALALRPHTGPHGLLGDERQEVVAGQEGLDLPPHTTAVGNECSLP